MTKDKDPEWDALCEQHGRKDGPDVGDDPVKGPGTPRDIRDTL
jgi:hypothetical protein